MVTTHIESVGVGKTYTTLAAWITARKGDIVSSDTVEVAEIYGGGDVGPANLLAADWTVNSTMMNGSSKDEIPSRSCFTVEWVILITFIMSPLQFRTI
jgi:hypothetical protein